MTEACLHFSPDINISAIIGWIAMAFGTDIHGAQKMNPNDVSSGHEADICGLEWKVSKTIGWLALTFGTYMHVHFKMNCNNFYYPFTFHQVQSKF